MRYKKLLNIILLAGSFCFVSVVGYGKTDQVLIINKVLGAEVILAIGSIALVIVTAIHILTVRRLTLQSNRYLRINTVCSQISIVCSQIATRVAKRSQFEAGVTKIRLKGIDLEANDKIMPELKEKLQEKLNYREEEYKKTIKETQNKIDNLEKKLEKLEGKLENG